MKEKYKGYFKELRERAKVKPGEEGALGPVDDFNRISYSFSKPAFIIFGGGTLFFPPLLPAGILTGLWAGSDKAQLEGSKWLRRLFKRKEVKGNIIPKSRTVFQA